MIVNIMNIKINKNLIFLVINIIVLAISFLVVLDFHKSIFLILHDFFYSRQLNIFHPPVCRIPGLIIGWIFNVFLPDLFNINQQDFRCGIGGFLVSIFYVLICFIFSKSFFVSKEKKSIFDVQFSIIYIFSFILLSFPFYCLNNFQRYFLGISEISVFGEYCAGYIVYFSFWLFIIKNLNNNNLCNLTTNNTKNKETGKLKKIIYITVAFLLGLWCELFSLSTFFTLVLFIFYLLIFNRNQLKENKNLKILLVSFFIGFISLIIIALNVGSIGAQCSFSIKDTLNFDINIINNFTYLFFKKVIFEKSIFLICILALLVFIKRKNLCPKDIIWLLIFVIAGYFASNYSYIILTNLRGHELIFLRDEYNCIELNILEFIILVLIGFLNNYSAKIKKITSIIFIILIAVVSYMVSVCYNYCKEERYKIKAFAYKVEKTITLYNMFGESAILPNSLFEQGTGSFPYNIIIPAFNHLISLEDLDKLKDRYLDEYYYRFYRIYYNANYKNKFKAIIYRDDEIAKKELQKRLYLLNTSIEDFYQIKDKNLKFSDINKELDKKLNINDIKKLEGNFGNNDILLKAKAYVYFSNKEDSKAIQLYKQYLKKYNNDFDAVLNLSEIYKRNNMIEDYEKMIRKLISLDEKNIIHLFSLLEILYNKKDYKEAIILNKKMIELYPELSNNYINLAILYNISGNKKETQNLFETAKKKNMKSLDFFNIEKDTNLRLPQEW